VHAKSKYEFKTVKKINSRQPQNLNPTLHFWWEFSLSAHDWIRSPVQYKV